jgi:hypothetical protein
LEGRLVITTVGISEDNQTAKKNLEKAIELYNQSLEDRGIEVIGAMYYILEDVREDTRKTRIRATLSKFPDLLELSKDELEKRLLSWLQLSLDAKSGNRNKYDHCAIKRTKGTCEWLLKIQEFKEWRDNDESASRVLWMHGQSGSGKSFATAYALRLIYELKTKSESFSKYQTIFFFCSNLGSTKQTSIEILKSLLFQLWTTTNDLPAYSQTWDRVMEPMFDDEALLEALETVIQWLFAASKRQTRIFIDAVDECDEDGRLIDAILKLLDKTKPACKAFLSSRIDRGSSAAKLGQSSIPQIRLDGFVNGRDIENHIYIKLEEARKSDQFLGDRDLLKKIADKLQTRADGM